MEVPPPALRRPACAILKASGLDLAEDMAELSEERVKHLAWLARLELSEEEVARFTGQLAKVLDYFKVLDEAEVEGVEPAFNVLGLTNVMRDDEPGPTLSQEEALANAPAREDGYVEAPAMVM